MTEMTPEEWMVGLKNRQYEGKMESADGLRSKLMRVRAKDVEGKPVARSSSKRMRVVEDEDECSSPTGAKVECR
jgi:hypothetical protein